MINIWGWLRSKLGRGSKRAPTQLESDWDSVPFSFATDWCVSANEMLDLTVDQIRRQQEALRKALRDSDRSLP